MPTTIYQDFIAGVRDIGSRTDDVGDPVDDLSAEEDRLINGILTPGWLSHSRSFEVRPTPVPSMNLVVGSGTARHDVYVVDGRVVGQQPYLVQLNEADITVQVPAADAASRTDEVYLVVLDDGYDNLSRGLPRIGYRRGDAGSGAPGPDSQWEAFELLASYPVAGGASEISSLTDERVQAIVVRGIKIGKVDFFAGSLPAGYVEANGQALSRSTYAALFTEIDTTYGSGDGSTTFNVPNIQNRAIVGAGGQYSVGQTFGANNVTLGTQHIPSHSHSGPSHSHTSGTLSAGSTSLGSHNHSSGSLAGTTAGSSHFHGIRVTRVGSTVAHNHSTTQTTSGIAASSGNANIGREDILAPGSASGPVRSFNSTHQHGITGSTGSRSLGSHGHSIGGSTATSGTQSTGSVGGGQSHENRPPSIALRAGIYTGVV